MHTKYNTVAIVLKKKSLLHRDVFISLFTEDNGKLAIIAKGVKSMTSRRMPHLQTGNLIKVQLKEHHNTIYLQESKLISGFSKIRENHNKQRYLYQMLYLVEKLLPENQKEERIFALLQQYIIDLSENDFTVKNSLKYFNMLLQHLGYSSEDKSYSDLRIMIEDIIHQKIPLFDI